MVTALIFLYLNSLAVVLHHTGHGHSHADTGHGHSHTGGQHQHNAPDYKPQTNASIRAAFIHVIGDLFQSISVLISALIIYFKPQYKIADPICTFIFSIFVLATTVTVLRDILIVLMEGFTCHSILQQLSSERAPPLPPAAQPRELSIRE
ncbi:hypothetical protein AB205_0098610 [Aquarana catesbeiana]|uniref:Proton-coupled zinc antiporter SLC30A8 n=1 Tax=Aquarana catesbeiana TaxID=8400 RepID=A0A2G9RCZ2_AQUCT|nr:hypothetical protein AB205_0098610 [Aquarana catesbeiana]